MAPPVLIAGGGVGGLATAIALAQHGIASHVLERSAQFSEAGAGIQIGPNGVRALRRLGAEALLEPQAGRPDCIAVFAGKSGQELARLPLGAWIETRHGAPYLVAHRADLQAALLARAARAHLVQITMGFEAVQYIADREGVSVRAADGATTVGVALIAADGQFSRLRQQLFGTAPRFSGQSAARTVLPADMVRAHIDIGCVGVWLAPDAHVVHYPVRAGREIAVVAITAETQHDQNWSTPVDRDRVLAALIAFASPIRVALEQSVEWRRWALYETSPLQSWSKGRVTLLGDAAHLILPFLAQGGSMALEDAITLADCIAADRSNIDGALHRYSTARMQRTRRVAAAAYRNGRIFHLAGLSAQARNAVLRMSPGALLMRRYDWLYGWRAEGAR